MQLTFSGKIQLQIVLNAGVDLSKFIIHMNLVIEGQGALVIEAGEEQPLKAGDFALVNPEGLTQVIPMKSTNTGTRVTSLSK